MGTRSSEAPLEIRVRAAAHEYPVWIGAGVLARSWEFLGQHLEERPVAIVTHRRLRRLYGKALTASWPAEQRPLWLEVPVGEGAKSLTWVRRLTSALARDSFPRAGRLVALGGGVVGDLCGFVASCYHRGVGFVQVPTTVVSQVDSSVGGKTGVNLPQGKNLVGAFHAPLAVLMDPMTLGTLPRRELLAGQAEVVKYGLLRDPALFERCARELPDPPDWRPFLEASVRHKASVVEADEREAGERRCLNLGHTMGHALEAAGRFSELLHGEAVALGTRFVYRVAARLGAVTAEDLARVDAFYRETGVAPAYPRYPYKRLRKLLARDKKADAAGLVWVLPTGIGSWRIERGIDDALLEEVHRELGREARKGGAA